MKKIIVILITVTLFACVKLNKIELPIGSNVYEVKYPSDWIKDDREWLYHGDLLNIQKPNSKSGPHGPFAFGNIHTLVSKKDKDGLCAGFFTESKFEDDEEGPDTYVNYKKDKVIIAGKYVERWSSNEKTMFIEVFFEIDDKNCILFSLVPAASSYEDLKAIEKDFYSIIKSFHRIKN